MSIDQVWIDEAYEVERAYRQGELAAGRPVSCPGGGLACGGTKEYDPGIRFPQCGCEPCLEKFAAAEERSLLGALPDRAVADAIVLELCYAEWLRQNWKAAQRKDGKWQRKRPSKDDCLGDIAEQMLSVHTTARVLIEVDGAEAVLLAPMVAFLADRLTTGGALGSKAWKREWQR